MIAMRYSRPLPLTLTLLAFFRLSSVDAIAVTGGRLLLKDACVRSGRLPSSLTFIPVVTFTECAALCREDCVAVLLNTDGTTPLCAILQHIDQLPVNSMVSCDDALASEVVYRIADVQAGLVCHAELTAFGRYYCLHNTHKETKSMTEAQTVCQEMGGQLPEAETSEHLVVIGSFVDSSKFIWMGATDHVTRDHYVWPQGEPMDRSLFGENEPNGVDERCTILLLDRTIADASCDLESNPSITPYIVCAIVLI